MINGISTFKNRLNYYQLASYFLILIGISIRVYHYLVNRSLWLDEAMLANNIINRDFSQLLETLDRRQIAPIGFLLVQKTSSLLFGVNEFAFRLFPLLCGVFSIPLLYLLLKKIANEKTALLGLLFFIFGRYLLYYSHEAKQYNLDLIIYIASFYFFYYKNITNYSYIRLLGIGFIGGLFVWFSHLSAVFLVSISIFLLLRAILNKDLFQVKKVLIPIFIWATSVCLNYFLFIHNHSNETVQTNAFTSIGYFPPNPFRFENLAWFYTLTIHLIQFPLGTSSGIFVLFVIICGLFYIIKTKKYKILILGMPILIHLVLSFLKLYPFYGRFILYTTVFVIILTVMGFKMLIEWKPRIGYIISIITVIAFMELPIRGCLNPFYFEEIRPSIEYIENNREENDAIYVYLGAIPAFDYYQNLFNLNGKIIEGKVYTPDHTAYDSEIERLKELNLSRVWILYSHNRKEDRNYFLEQNSKIGELKLHYEFGGASAHLFEIY